MPFLVFGRHSKLSMMRCRKCNFVLIGIKVGVLLTFLASMKAKVLLCQKYISVFSSLHVKNGYMHLCIFLLAIITAKCVFHIIIYISVHVCVHQYLLCACLFFLTCS